MKKTLLLLFVLVATTLSAQVQYANQVKLPGQGEMKILEQDVPAVVLESFYKNTKLDKSIVVQWRSNGKEKQYSGLFYRDVLKSYAYILEDGKFLYLYEDIRLKDIPAKISQYMSDNVPNATIMAASIRSESGGKIYQLKISEIMGGESTRAYNKTYNYQFDPEGNLIRFW